MHQSSQRHRNVHRESAAAPAADLSGSARTTYSNLPHRHPRHLDADRRRRSSAYLRCHLVTDDGTNRRVYHDAPAATPTGWRDHA
jgi:hypothetical protein